MNIRPITIADSDWIYDRVKDTYLGTLGKEIVNSWIDDSRPKILLGDPSVEISPGIFESIFCRLLHYNIPDGYPMGNISMATHVTNLHPLYPDAGFLSGIAGPLLAESLGRMVEQYPNLAQLTVWAWLPPALVNLFKQTIFSTASTNGSYIWMRLDRAAQKVAFLRPH